MPVARSHAEVEIHYESHGHGPIPLVFLHGWGGSSRTWDAVFACLDLPRFRAIRLDLRGHGKSTQPAFGYTWEDFDRDVLAVLDQEHVGRFVPVGFSMGGKLACYLAAQHPDRVAAQILVAPSAPGLVPIERELGLQICREAKNEGKVRGVFGSWFGPGAPATLVDSCCATIAATPQFVLAGTAEMTLWTSIENVVGRVRSPSLLVIGKSDPVYGEAYQRAKMLPFLSKVQTVSLRSGHFVPLECPADLAELINQRVPHLWAG